MPESTRVSLARGNVPVRSVSKLLSRLTICETLATESLGSPVTRGDSITLPGAFAHLTLLVSGTHTTVAIRLRLKGSPCTTTTGLRSPGPDPIGSGNSAHQTSPCEITTRCGRGRGEPQQTGMCRAENPLRRRLGPSIPLHSPAYDARHTRRVRWRTIGFWTFSYGAPVVPPSRRLHLESRLRFSYPEYNQPRGCGQGLIGNQARTMFGAGCE